MLNRRGVLAGVAAVLAAGGPVAVRAAAGLAPGTRLVWDGGAASIPGSRSQVAPDADGRWIDRRTGERYSEFDTPGAAGMGYVALDVLESSAKSSLVWMTLLLCPDGLGGPASFIDANGLRSGPGEIADYWMSPATLARIPATDTAGLRVLRLRYDRDGRSYDAIRIQRQHGTGWSQNTFDLDTGLCLASGSTLQGSPVLTLGADKTIGAGEGSTQLAFTRLAGRRRTHLPGVGARFPDEIRALSRIRYSGTKTARIADGQEIAIPFRLSYDIVGRRSSTLDVRASIAGVAGSQPRLIAAGVIGSLWMDPTSLRTYRAGDALDADPLTGVRAVARGSRGGLATVALETPLSRHAFSYDLGSGLLSGAELRQRNGMVTDTVAIAREGAD